MTSRTREGASEKNRIAPAEAASLAEILGAAGYTTAGVVTNPNVSPETGFVHFGRFLDGLRERDLYDDSLIVFISDHGEEFAEHGGWTYGRTLFRESVRVPLIIKYPGVTKATRVSDVVQQVDLVPTLLDYLDLEPPPALPGRSLLPFQSTDPDLSAPARPGAGRSGRRRGRAVCGARAAVARPRLPGLNTRGDGGVACHLTFI